MNNSMFEASKSIQGYRNWEDYNRAQIKEKKYFLELLFELCKFVPDVARKPGAGRSPLPLRDMVFAIVLQAFVCTSSRRFTTDMTAAKEQGYVEYVPHFNSVCRYRTLPEMYTVLQELVGISSSPLAELEDEFSVDSSGFSTGQSYSWVAEKWGNGKIIKKRGIWLKCHLTCGNASHIVVAVNITGLNGADSPEFIPLIRKTSERFKIKRVMADKAYLSELNLKCVDNKGGVAFIPFKPNNRAGANHGDVWNTLYHYFHLHHDLFKKYYRRRANVECAFSMIKRKFDERLRSKTLTAQKNEVLCKLLSHNICCVIRMMVQMQVKPGFRKDPSYPYNG